MTKAVENQFLAAVGHVIQMQVQLAVASLLETINEQNEELRAHKLYCESLVRQLSQTFVDKGAVKVIVDGEIKSGLELGELADFDNVVDACGKNLHEATLPLLQKIDFLETQVKMLSAGWQKDMNAVRETFIDLDKVNIRNLIDQRIAEIPQVEILHGKDGVDGKDGADCDMTAVIEFARDYLASIPKPKDGADGKDGVDGKDGSGVVLEDVMNALDQTVNKRVTEFIDSATASIASIPTPKDGKDGRDGIDGKSVSIDEASAVIHGCVLDAVAALPAPRHVASGHIDRDGCLHLVLNDGTQLSLGHVVGKDGDPGKDGKDGDPGKDGKDGADGLGFKDMQVTFDGERDLIFKFVLDERIEEFSLTLPFQLYQGIWKAGQYRRGDTVTRDGSQWVALQDTSAMPGTVNSGWQLSVKRGRDGKDGVGKEGPPGLDGKDGRDGKDLTQIGPDGSKWG